LLVIGVVISSVNLSSGCCYIEYFHYCCCHCCCFCWRLKNAWTSKWRTWR